MMLRTTFFAAFLAVGNGLAAAEEPDGVFQHVQALHAIAVQHGGNRDSGTPGYDASARYVAEQLEAAGYAVRFEEFEFPVFDERTPPLLAFDASQAPNDAISTLFNSGSGDISARLSPVDLGLTDATPPPPSTSGCEFQDFADFARGSIALIRRGQCPFQTKAENAVAAGASGVVVMNEGGERRSGRFGGRLTEPVSIPVVAIPYDLGARLARNPTNATVRLRVDARLTSRSTRNVIAETEAGDPARIVVVGAHLDSVPNGPGINDNASGVAAVLEAALRLAASETAPALRVRFAFWGAEERGLLGSRRHVDKLSEEEIRSIAAYVNLDMVGSVNFGRFVLHAKTVPERPSGVLRRALLDWFARRGLRVVEREENTRPRGYASDDWPFSQKDVATLGLHTGANMIKDSAEAALFGGTAGKPADPCYHRPCDGLDNIDRGVLNEMTDALSYALRIAAGIEKPPPL